MKTRLLQNCLILLTVLCTCVGLRGQSDTSAIMDISSTTQGILIPRMTLAQRQAIVSPATSLLVYQIDSLSAFYFFNGTDWSNFEGPQGPAGPNGIGFFEVSPTNPSHIIYTNAANNGKNFIVNADSVNDDGDFSAKMMFIPIKSAFRAGIVSNKSWDLDSIGNYSFATGFDTKASGLSSTAMGQASTASGLWTTAMGMQSIASGQSAVAIGSNVVASDLGAVAIGYGAIASGRFTTAIGADASATNAEATAIGINVTASGTGATALGSNTHASGQYSTATGIETKSSGSSSTTIGRGTKAKSFAELAIGNYNDTLTAVYPFAMTSDSNRIFTVGLGTDASNLKTGFVIQHDGNVGINKKVATEKLDIAGSIKIVDGTQGAGKVLTSDAAGKASWQLAAGGGFFRVDPNFTNSIAYTSTANYGKDFIVNSASVNYTGETAKMFYMPSKWAFRAGRITNPSWDIDSIGLYSTALGNSTLAKGIYSFAAGDRTKATGANSTALGRFTEASGTYSFATGNFSVASGQSAYALGYAVTASGMNSTSMGWYSVASGDHSTALGLGGQALSFASTAMGSATKASGRYSTAMGSNTHAKSLYETVIGSFNDTLTSVNANVFANDSNRVFTVGIGTAANALKTAFVIQQNGNVGINKKVATEKLDIAGSIKIVDGTEGAGKILTSDADGKASWQSAAGSSELEKVMEAGNTGWRILGKDPLNYGDIGFNAIDLSESNSASTTRGATAEGAFAAGFRTTASGDFSVAMGVSTEATSYGSTAIGSESVASGENSTALGKESIASGDYAAAIGEGVIASGENATATGYLTIASGDWSTAMGSGSIASSEMSTSMGYNTIAKSFAEVVIGAYNDTLMTVDAFNISPDSNRIFTVGIGDDDDNRITGFVIQQNGNVGINKKVATEKLDIAGSVKIVDGTEGAGKVLTSDADGKASWQPVVIGGASELEKVTEIGKTGWRILGKNPLNYGDIGSNAIDLSESNSTSTTYGATGENAFATGSVTSASGKNSTAMGYCCIASGESSTSIGHGAQATGYVATALGSGTYAIGNSSTAIGYSTNALGIISFASGQSTIASADVSTAMGYGTKAHSFSETVLGTYNTAYTPTSSSAYNANDRAFGVGIGADINNRKDGFIVFKSGNTFISNDGNTPANGTASVIPGFGVGALQVRSSGDGFNLRTGTGNNSMNIAKASAPSNGNTYLALGYINGASFTEAGSIKANGPNGVSFNTSSDKRLKIDHGIYSDALSTLNKLAIHNYTWKIDSTADIGVFAQELYKVYPLAVSKGDDNHDASPDDIKERWSVDYSKLVPLLVSSAQELALENEALKAQILELSSQVKQMANFKSDLEAIKVQLNSNVGQVTSK